jgi:hypothetical protein
MELKAIQLAPGSILGFCAFDATWLDVIMVMDLATVLTAFRAFYSNLYF